MNQTKHLKVVITHDSILLFKIIFMSCLNYPLFDSTGWVKDTDPLFLGDVWIYLRFFDEDKILPLKLCVHDEKNKNPIETGQTFLSFMLINYFLAFHELKSNKRHKYTHKHSIT